MKVPKIQTYFPYTEDIIQKHAEQKKKWGFHSLYKGASIDNKKVRNFAQIRHSSGVLQFTRECFGRHLKALQNAFKKGTPFDELNGDFFNYHTNILTKDGSLFTGKALIFDGNNQVTRIDKIKNGKPVSSLILRAGLIPSQYTSLKPIEHNCYNAENTVFDTGKYYVQRFVNGSI